MDGEEAEKKAANPENPSVSLPPVADSDKHKCSADNGGQPPENPHPWHEKAKDWLRGFNEPITVVTLLLFFATVGLWLATKDLVHDAKESSERQLRAYVGLTTATPLGVDQTRVMVPIDNFGQTPANFVKVFTNWEFLGPYDELPKDFKFLEKSGCPTEQHVLLSNSPVFPKNIIKSQRLHCPGDLEQLLKAESGNATAYLYGHIEYFDIFEKKRRTNFCFLYGPGGAALCDRYNEIDPDEK